VPVDPAERDHAGTLWVVHTPPASTDHTARPGVAPRKGRAADAPTGDGNQGRVDGGRRTEILAGLALLAVTAIGGVYVAQGNAPSSLDTLVPGFLRSGHRSVFTNVTSLRYPAVVVAAAVILALVAARRDRVRSLVCLIGPPLALLTSELAIKPLVDRTLGSGLSYPSGSTVGAAALGTAAVLVVPGRWRRLAIVLASIYGVWMAIAVTSLQWHYPTDALAGLTYGCGVMLVVDWVARRGSDAHRSATGRHAAPAEVHR
jgi:membrane-associated phospholipid phosphatase